MRRGRPICRPPSPPHSGGISGTRRPNDIPWETRHGQLSRGRSSHAHTGLAAQDRAGAVLRGDAALRLRLHSLHRLPVVHRLQDAAELHARRLGELPQALGAGKLAHRHRQYRHFREPLHHHLHGARPHAGDLSRSEDPGRGGLAADLSLPDGAVLHRDGTAWKWFLDPGIGLEHVMHLWGWRAFPSPGSRTTTWRSTRS